MKRSEQFLRGRGRLLCSTLSSRAEAFLHGCRRSRTMIRPVSFIVFVALLSAAATARAQTLTTLYAFGAGPFDGEDPQSGVVFDDQGNLWGMTTLGGNLGGAGTVFRLEPPAGEGPWTEVIVHR